MAIKGSKFRNYSPEFKIQVVEDYLSGKSGGIKSVSEKYKLSNEKRVRDWVKIYKQCGLEAFLIETRGRSTKADGVNKGRPLKKTLDDMTKDEQIAYLKMENDILKKVQALQKH